MNDITEIDNTYDIAFLASLSVIEVEEVDRMLCNFHENFLETKIHIYKVENKRLKRQLSLTSESAYYLEQGKYDECINCCQQFIDIVQANRDDCDIVAKAYLRMANAYLKQDKLKEAVQYFNKSLFERRDPEIEKKRTEIDNILKQNELAMEEKNRGNDCYMNGAYAEATKHYSEAIKTNPNDAKLYINRAACYAKLMEFNCCISDCDEGIRLDPTSVKGYLRKGGACLLLKQTGQAKIAFEEALRLDPNNQEAWEALNRCLVVVHSKNEDEILKKANEDPEVRQILADREMSMILEQMTNESKFLPEHLKNPEIMKKIEKLMDAGIVGMR